MLTAKRAGRFITVTSIAGELARPGDAIYPIAKQGLAGMVRALAVEYGGQGIISNGIAPGTFVTETNAAQHGRASGRERVGQYVLISVGAGSFKTKIVTKYNDIENILEKRLIHPEDC